MKRLIVCCDGTWQGPDELMFGESTPTNVVKLAVRIAKMDGLQPQIIWYDQGVGTGNILDRALGGLSGVGLDENLNEAYRFLVANYVPGDELFLFGFSRGAYTVRSLAGMIRKCGIVRRDKILSYLEAVKLYRNEDHPDDHVPARFRSDSSVTGTDPIPIQCIGVWDTVGALGIPLRRLSKYTREKYQFHDTALSRTVKYAYHALAIDEYREPFTPTLWTSAPGPEQTLEQVWFSGSHTDVGGGPGSRGLPEISLQWMIDKARTAGLVFDDVVLGACPLTPDPTAPMNRYERSRLWIPLRRERVLGVSSRTDPDEALDPTQSIHPEVLGRWDTQTTYRPSNLRRYLARLGDPRSEARGSPSGWTFGKRD